MAQETDRHFFAHIFCVHPRHVRLSRPSAQSVAPKVPFSGGMLVLGFGLLGTLVAFTLFVVYCWVYSPRRDCRRREETCSTVDSGGGDHRFVLGSPNPVIFPWTCQHHELNHLDLLFHPYSRYNSFSRLDLLLHHHTEAIRRVATRKAPRYYEWIIRWPISISGPATEPCRVQCSRIRGLHFVALACHLVC